VNIAEDIHSHLDSINDLLDPEDSIKVVCACFVEYTVS